MGAVGSAVPAKPHSQTLDDERPRPDGPDRVTFHHHLARYQFALGQMAGGERVLDAGCGTGYGSRLLREKGQSVVGVDYSPHAIAYAREHYEGPALTYAVMDGNFLAFPPSQFDFLVSFEVIEHMVEPEQFLRECTRVLGPSGRLILSTPNRTTTDIHMRSIGQKNEFHVSMFDVVGFRRVLGRHFAKVELYGQRRRGNPLYSVLRSLDVWNLRLRLLPNRRRERLQQSFGVAVGEDAQPEQWIFARTQIRQANQLVAVCQK
jgi:SAM-dependent methyltransferase